MKNNLKEIRKSRHITQEELGNMIGTDKMHIWRLERGDRQLTQRWLEKIAKALNCKVGDIIQDNNETKEETEFLYLTEEEKNLIRTFRKIKENENNKNDKKAG